MILVLISLRPLSGVFRPLPHHVFAAAFIGLQ
jgi:hypothetical protein